MFPTNGSETTGVIAVGAGELTGGVHGLACCGGGAEIAGGGIQAGLMRAGGECAEIKPGPVDEFAKFDGPAGAESDGCHVTPGPDFFAFRDSSLALTTPYVRQPISMQISAANKVPPNSNPNTRSAV